MMKDTYLSRDFRSREFACKCRRAGCSAPPMDSDFIAKLQALRDLWGSPLVITSGSRCATYNSLVGGAHMSQHLLGKAADIHLDHPDAATRMILLAEKVGFGGIGKARSFLHVDSGPAGRRWSYS
jgi:uncharacterized protein YcbK (DUF882 family)